MNIGRNGHAHLLMKNSGKIIRVNMQFAGDLFQPKPLTIVLKDVRLGVLYMPREGETGTISTGGDLGTQRHIRCFAVQTIQCSFLYGLAVNGDI